MKLDDMDAGIVERLAELTGVSTEQVETMILDASRDAAGVARETVQGNCPIALAMLAVDAQAETGETITAVTRATSRRFAPERPVSDGCAWQMRRLAGKVLPSDPPVVEEVSDCWAFAVAGNPIIVEGWLREQGYSLAMAPSPNVVTVCPVGDPILEVRYV